MNSLTSMPKHNEYTDSGISWFGSIPSHWEGAPLCSVSKLKSIKNHVDEPLLSVYLDKGVIRFDEVEAKRTNVTSLDLSKYQLVEPGNFVLNNQQAWRGSVGVSAHRGIVSPAYLVLQLSSKIYPRFGNYLFRDGSMVANYLVNSKGVGTIQRNLYWPQLKRALVFFPGLDEQISIANFLDEKTSQIDEVIAIKQKQIELLKERKQIIIQQAVTQGLNPDVPMKDSEVDWIGDIPEHWDTKKLKFVSHGFMYGTSVDCNSLESGTPVLRIPNIDEITINLSDLKYANLSSDETKKYSLSKNDILIIRTNGNPALVGKSAIVDADDLCLFASYLIKLTPKSNIEPSFLIRTMNSFSVRGALTYSARTSAGNYNLNTQALGDCHIAFPPREEQIQIADFVDRVSAKTDQSLALVTEQIAKLKEYKTTLINSAVTGKIKVTKLV
ncbi:TPA: restriction endonuclease subunit S [Photobacterium damselae]